MGRVTSRFLAVVLVFLSVANVSLAEYGDHQSSPESRLQLKELAQDLEQKLEAQSTEDEELRVLLEQLTEQLRQANNDSPFSTIGEQISEEREKLKREAAQFELADQLKERTAAKLREVQSLLENHTDKESVYLREIVNGLLDDLEALPVEMDSIIQFRNIASRYLEGQADRMLDGRNVMRADVVLPPTPKGELQPLAKNLKKLSRDLYSFATLSVDPPLEPAEKTQNSAEAAMPPSPFNLNRGPEATPEQVLEEIRFLKRNSAALATHDAHRIEHDPRWLTANERDYVDQIVEMRKLQRIQRSPITRFPSPQSGNFPTQVREWNARWEAEEMQIRLEETAKILERRRQKQN